MTTGDLIVELHERRQRPDVMAAALVLELPTSKGFRLAIIAASADPADDLVELDTFVRDGAICIGFLAFENGGALLSVEPLPHFIDKLREWARVDLTCAAIQILTWMRFEAGEVKGEA